MSAQLVRLNTTATAGSPDDDGTAGAMQVEGLYLTTARGGIHKEGFNARFTVRQSIPQESEVRSEPRVGFHGMVRVGIECVVDRNTEPRPDRFVSAYHGITATIGEHHVVLRHERMEWILGIRLQAVQCCGRIYVPENRRHPGSTYVEHRSLEHRITERYHLLGKIDSNNLNIRPAPCEEREQSSGSR